MHPSLTRVRQQGYVDLENTVTLPDGTRVIQVGVVEAMVADLPMPGLLADLPLNRRTEGAISSAASRKVHNF